MHQQGQGNEHACAIAIKISSEKIRFTAYGVTSWVLNGQKTWTRMDKMRRNWTVTEKSEQYNVT